MLKFGQQFKTIYRLACLDRTSPGQAKMSSLKVKSVRNRGWAHNPKVPSSNLGPATRKGTHKCLFSFKKQRNQGQGLGSRGYEPHKIRNSVESVNLHPFEARIADHFVQSNYGFDSHRLVQKSYPTSFALGIVVTPILFGLRCGCRLSERMVFGEILILVDKELDN